MSIWFEKYIKLVFKLLNLQLLIFSSGLWLLYGICKPDSKIIIVNVVGVLLMLSYSIVFYVYTFKKSSVLKQSLVAIILYLVMVVYMSTEIDNEILLVRLGLYDFALIIHI